MDREKALSEAIRDAIAGPGCLTSAAGLTAKIYDAESGEAALPLIILRRPTPGGMKTPGAEKVIDRDAALSATLDEVLASAFWPGRLTPAQRAAAAESAGRDATEAHRRPKASSNGSEPAVDASVEDSRHGIGPTSTVTAGAGCATDDAGSTVR
jgi:hypothetical protein